MRSTIIVALLALGMLVAVQGARVRLHPDDSTVEDLRRKGLDAESEEDGDELQLQDCINGKNSHSSCTDWWWNWGEWTSCSKTCGGGLRYRRGERYCHCKTWGHGNVRCENIEDEEIDEGCEQWCVTGHFDPIKGQCTCNDDWYGYCCEIPMNQNQELVDKFRKAQEIIKGHRPHLFNDIDGNVTGETDAPGNITVAPPNGTYNAREEHILKKEPRHAQPVVMDPVVGDVKEEAKDVKHSDQGNMGSTSVLVAGCFAGLAAIVAAVVLAVFFKTRLRKPLEPLTINNPTFKY